MRRLIELTKLDTLRVMGLTVLGCSLSLAIWDTWMSSCSHSIDDTANDVVFASELLEAGSLGVRGEAESGVRLLALSK